LLTISSDAINLATLGATIKRIESQPSKQGALTILTRHPNKGASMLKSTGGILYQ
jgi:hypothetical protein